MAAESAKLASLGQRGAILAGVVRDRRLPASPVSHLPVVSNFTPLRCYLVRQPPTQDQRLAQPLLLVSQQ